MTERESLMDARARLKGLCDEVAALQSADALADGDAKQRFQAVRDQLVMAALYEIPQLLEATDVYALRRTVARWLRIRGNHCDETMALASYIVPKDKQAQTFSQLAADADHSDLLVRLFKGEEPLPFETWKLAYGLH